MRRPITNDKLADLRLGENGLATTEVESRRARYGYNDIVESQPTGWRDVLRDTGKDPMLWFLVATSALFAVVGNYTEALVLAAAVFPLVGMDAFLHRRTQASTQGLRTRLAESANVLRDGRWQALRALELVPGDLVRVTSGESFPADGIVVTGDSLQADESALTGEAFPVVKTSLRNAPTDAAEPSIEGEHWGFAGTRLLTGDARVRIVDTGGATIYGEIVRSAAFGARAQTPLQRAIAKLVALLLAVAAVLCVAVATIRLSQGHGLVDALLSAVTLAVAALPEEFPIVFTFTLGVGIFRLAKRQALVRRAVVVENIGRVTYICTDKTGTLTEGRIRVERFVPANGVSEHGLATVAAYASRSDGGDPLDQAILAAAPNEKRDSARLATFPFTEDRRRETAAFRSTAGTIMVAMKGAPETILARCRLEPHAHAEWSERVRELADSAHKVIGCASRELAADEWTGQEPDGDYEFLGLLACGDPVRDGVVDAVRQATAAGIRVTMITGDHAGTARAIARAVGIGGEDPRAIEGDRLEAELAANGSHALPEIDVIACALPAQKVRLVQALQSRGEIVAVTGDGVNDVPALQAADIGIAMGEHGTRSAREASAIVLLDDNFRTIVSAIREGQQLLRNLRTSFAYLLMIHLPLVATATLIPLAGYPLPYLPAHIVWLELIIHPTALLVFQGASTADRLAPARQHAKAGQLLNGRHWAVVGAVGVLATLVVFLGYERNIESELAAEHARAVALVMLVMLSAGLTAILSRMKTTVARAVVTLSAASAVVFVQVAPLARLLHLEPLHAGDWAIAVAGGVVPATLASLFWWRRSAKG